MLTYAKLKQCPAALRSFTGLTPDQFTQLYAEFAAAYEPAEEARLFRPNRQRCRGAGHQFHHPLSDRLLLALIWLRIYPTHAVLGFLFGLHKSNISRQLASLLPLLRKVTSVDLAWPTDAQRKRSWKDLLTDFPEVQWLVDTTEQRIQRPHDPDTQKTYYSGKKKAHTLKTQVVITPDRQIVEVTESVPGKTNDLTLLRESELLTRFPDGDGLLDAAYQGVRNDPDPHPERLRHAHRAARGHPLTAEQKAANRTLSKARVRIEHTLGQAKTYQVLAQVYRHPRARYHTCFCIVAALTNRRRGFHHSVAC